MKIKIWKIDLFINYLSKMYNTILPLNIIEIIYKFYFDTKLVCESHLPIPNHQLPSKHYIRFIYYSVYYVNIFPKTNVQNYLCATCLKSCMEISDKLKDIDYCNYWYSEYYNGDYGYIYEVHHRLTLQNFIKLFIKSK
mgnify:CR=1 FL=1